jgi:Mg-chelatase subunit ChlD
MKRRGVAGIGSGRRNGGTPRDTAGERGAALILFTFMIISVMAPLIGFAIDGGICYWMKAKLSSSVDSAALAAARSLSLASSSSQLQSQGATTASQYFTANFQTGSMGTSLPGVTQASPCADNSNPCTTVTLTSAQQITVTVQATVSVPLYFLRLLGFNNATISDTGQSTRRSANVMLVLDRSYSMEEAGVCSTLVASAENFVNDFVDGRDTLGLITFQATANNDYALNTYFKSSSPTLNSTLSQLVCTGYTTTAEALTMAYQKLSALNEPDALNVILLFTDGQPDSIVATFPVKTLSDNNYRYQWYNTSSPANPSPPSGCAAGSSGNPYLSGVLIDADGAPDATGYTAGLYPDTPTAINYSSPYIAPATTISASGCAFINTTSYPTYTGTVREDIAYLPAKDNYGNLLTGYKTLDYYATGSPYAGLARVDTPRSVMYAATNAANNAAYTARAAGIVVYTIGLGGTPEQQIDTDFLMRVANDPTSSSYNSSQPAGLFVYATAGSLGQAFEQIASEILHLSQ